MEHFNLKSTNGLVRHNNFTTNFPHFRSMLLGDAIISLLCALRSLSIHSPDRCFPLSLSLDTDTLSRLSSCCRMAGQNNNLALLFEELKLFMYSSSSSAIPLASYDFKMKGDAVEALVGELYRLFLTLPPTELQQLGLIKNTVDEIICAALYRSKHLLSRDEVDRRIALSMGPGEGGGQIKTRNDAMKAVLSTRTDIDLSTNIEDDEDEGEEIIDRFVDEEGVENEFKTPQQQAEEGDGAYPSPDVILLSPCDQLSSLPLSEDERQLIRNLAESQSKKLSADCLAVFKNTYGEGSYPIPQSILKKMKGVAPLFKRPKGKEIFNAFIDILLGILQQDPRFLIQRDPPRVIPSHPEMYHKPAWIDPSIAYWTEKVVELSTTSKGTVGLSIGEIAQYYRKNNSFRQNHKDVTQAEYVKVICKSFRNDSRFKMCGGNCNEIWFRDRDSLLLPAIKPVDKPPKWLIQVKLSVYINVSSSISFI